MDGEHESIGERILREHEARLVVGARVRVRLSGECKYCQSEPLQMQSDGATGAVFHIDHIPDVRALDCFNADSAIHRIWGTFENGLEDWPYSHFAATELIPLTDADA